MAGDAVFESDGGWSAVDSPTDENLHVVVGDRVIAVGASGTVIEK